VPISNDRFRVIHAQVEMWKHIDAETLDPVVAREIFVEARVMLNEMLQSAHQDNRLWSWLRRPFTRR
jgi:hypothetical protein